MDDLGLVSVKGSGGPAAVLMRASGLLVIAQCHGEHDLSIRIVHVDALGQTHWPRDCPVSERLLSKVAKLSWDRHATKLTPILDTYLELTNEDTNYPIYA